jgi:glucose-1-phosphate thymidylyltransferase
MNLIIPMAGMGKRMRPHTLTVPKPLIPIAGKPIVQRLVEDVARLCNQPIDEIAFVVGRFGAEVEARLLAIAGAVGAQGRICYQDEALGTAHAVLCGEEVLNGPVIVAYADCLFRADEPLTLGQDAVIVVQKVLDPSAFGVVSLDEAGTITGFVEKPKTHVSDLAIIGVYYFPDGEALRSELRYLIDHDLKENNEYQLTNALENLRQHGTRFVPGQVDEWLDCGNKASTVQTNQRYLEAIRDQPLVASSAQIVDSVVIPPVFIGENVRIENTVLGPHVSVGNGSRLTRSVVRNSIVQEDSRLTDLVLSDSMVGNHAVVEGRSADLSVGDYNVIRA